MKPIFFLNTESNSRLLFPSFEGAIEHLQKQHPGWELNYRGRDGSFEIAADPPIKPVFYTLSWKMVPNEENPFSNPNRP